LLKHDLVDEFRLMTFPLTLGSGKKLFADGTVPRTFKLTRSETSSTGVVIAVYERAGEVAVGTAEFDTPSDAELARRKRLAKE
ncbi:MAG: dihydrofolate reductase family protein, partial [Patescibacteria group bacterium]